MKRTLKQRLADVESKLEQRVNQLRTAETNLKWFLEHRKVTYRQRKALKTLLAIIHVKTMTEEMMESLKHVYSDAIKEQLNSRSLLRLFAPGQRIKTQMIATPMRMRYLKGKWRTR